MSEVKSASRSCAVNVGALIPKAGYVLVAANFNDWHWVSFWRANERPQVQAWLQSLPPGMGLDAGSGTGAYVKDAYDAGHTCTQLDISFQMLAAQHSSKAASSDLSMRVQGDISHLPFRDGAFDWLLCTRVLGHVADLATAVRGFGRVLKSVCEMFFSDIHP